MERLDVERSTTMTIHRTGNAGAIEVRREEDDELLGLLVPSGDGRWAPSTIFGAALAAATDAGTAESVVREHGLASLAERWWVQAGGEWQQAWLLEVKPDRIRLRWDNPMLVQSGHGEWVHLDTVTVQRSRP